MNDKITQAIKLIQEARALALTGEYGQQDAEYEDVRVRFDEAIMLLENCLRECDPAEKEKVIPFVGTPLMLQSNIPIR